ncbi:MAG: 4-hydroxy-3-methylbut-2-enyl diphosphate reductase [Helicobacteraceae bacterium]|nr:4-hydroxy-3-methylbut-2-enyl diphosphate reductase [Helicobacteraceae bacterium]
MEIKLAESCGFCFGVKRAIRLAESNPNSVVIGELIHNRREIDRLSQNFGVRTAASAEEINGGDRAIIRTHGIEKEAKAKLLTITDDIIDATCPYVTKPQKIAETMSQKGYQIVIFGDRKHPEVKAVLSYADKSAAVVADASELETINIGDRVALISQTTKSIAAFGEVAAALIARTSEARVFNTICNATYDNQEATRKLAKEADIMIVIGGKNSSNTKQLHAIALKYCADSYLIEESSELRREWFSGKRLCGVSAGASTPDWIIEEATKSIAQFELLAGLD